MKNQWYKKACFYQIYPRSFCDSNGDGIGDIPGIISKVDYLASLNIDAIWFSPLYCSPNADYGYDISDYKNINPEYGTMQDFDRMVKLLHARNIKVIMDLVINHTSDKHRWFEESRKSKDNPYRNYYIWRDGRGKNGKKPPNNWTSFFLGTAWQYDELTGQWYLHLFDKNQPDLNYFNPRVLEEVKDVLNFWLKKGVDGFRCDVITLLSKREGLPDGKKRIALTGREHYLNGPKIEFLLRQLQEDVLSKYDAFTVGESVMIDVDTALKYTSGENPLLDTVFEFEHMNADNYFGIKQFVRKFSLKRLKKTIAKWQDGLYNKAWNTLYWENHDQARIVGRYCSATEYREEGAKMMGTILLTLSGTPFIYQGQEIGQTSAKMQDIEMYRDVESIRSYNTMRKIFGKKGAMKRISYCSRDNARTPVQWDSGANGGFTAGTPWLALNPNYTQINVAQQENEQSSVLNYYRKLIQLRKEHDVFIFGTYQDLAPLKSKLWMYKRSYDGDEILVVNNFSLKPQKVRAVKDAERYTLLTSNYPNSAQTPVARTLRPYESAVYILKEQEKQIDIPKDDALTTATVTETEQTEQTV